MDSRFDFTIRDSHRRGAQDWDRLWENLAVATDCMNPKAGAQALADRINASRNPVVVSLPLAHAVYGTVSATAARMPEGKAAANRLSDLLLRVKPALLAAALRTEVDLATRDAFLGEASRVLSPAALARTALAATSAWDRPVSPPLRELLKKLARAAAATTDEGAAAEAVLRDVIGVRLQVGSSSDSGFAHDLHKVQSARPVRRVAGRVTPEADRIVHMTLETGAIGGLLWIAVSEMLEQGRVRELLVAVKKAPDGSAAAAIVRRIASTGTLNAVLAEDPVDVEALDLLLHPMGIAAAKPMLEVLAESRLRATRRIVLERLARLGNEIAPLVETRLRDSRWFVVRNMLNLLREAGCTDSLRATQRFMQHTDPRVRREAVHLLLLNPLVADDALIAGLRDGDKTVLRVALQAARSRMPEAAVPVLAQRVVEDITFPPEFRVMALHTLGCASSALALDALLAYAQGGRSMLGRSKLAKKSPEMIAALGGLARSWRHDRRARALLDVARRSRDPQISDAVRASEEREET